MRRTRSSARQEAEESADEEVIVDAMEPQEHAVGGPPVAAPPHPPPPPPPRLPSSNNNVASHSVAVQTTNSYWTLTLYSRQSSPTRIAITPNMTPETLGRCILQATYGCDPLEDVDTHVAVSSE